MSDSNIFVNNKENLIDLVEIKDSKNQLESQIEVSSSENKENNYKNLNERIKNKPKDINININII